MNEGPSTLVFESIGREGRELQATRIESFMSHD